MEKTKRVFDYNLRTLPLLNQMKSNGENVLNLQVMEKNLHILTMRFEYKVTIIE